MFRSTTENEADVAALVERLKEISVGDVITKGQLKEAIGRSIEPRRYLLYRAFEMLEKEQGVVFANVHGVGYRRLPIESIPSVGRRTRHSIRRKAGRGMKAMSRAVQHINDMPNDTSIAIGREIGTLGLVRAVSRDSIVAKATEGVVSATPEPIAKVAERFLAALRGE